MAKQKSFLKIEGTIQDLTFYQGTDGAYYVRSKGGVSKNRIKNDPAFQRTRENGVEFGEVARSGKMFRRAISDLIYNVKDLSRTARLTGTLARVKNEDATSDRGERKVHIGIGTLRGKQELVGFEFNRKSPIGKVLKVNFEIDTTAGEISIPGFNPARHLDLPQGATHVEIQAGKLRFDFESGTGNLTLDSSSELEIENTQMVIELDVSGTSTAPGLDFYFLKIAFYQQINAKLYALQNGAYNAAQIIAIE